MCGSHTFVAINAYFHNVTLLSSLIYQNHRIHGLLEKCTYDHEARVEILRNDTHEKAISDAKWQQIQQNGVSYVSLALRISLEDYSIFSSIDDNMPCFFNPLVR